MRGARKPSAAPVERGPFQTARLRRDRRRQKYADDQDYQSTIKERSRDYYRKSQNLELSSCLRSLDFYTTLAKSMWVTTPKGRDVELRVMNIGSLANCLDKYYQTIWRWVQKGLIPEPALYSKTRQSGYYHVDEVLVLIEEIGRHEQLFAYYRSNHHEVRERIFSRISTIRNSWK